MSKKLVYLAGTGVAVGVAYLKGLAHGEEVTEKVEKVKEKTSKLKEEDVVNFEDTAAKHIGRLVKSTEGEINEETENEDNMVECKDDDCERTFDTKHGMKVHYGSVHKE